MTTRLIWPPFRRTVPGLGLSDITRPGLTIFEYAWRTFPTRQWARTTARFARGSVLPLTFGTVQRPVVLRRTVTTSGSFAVTRSGLPSPFRSPTATEFTLAG